MKRFVPIESGLPRCFVSTEGPYLLVLNGTTSCPLTNGFLHLLGSTERSKFSWVKENTFTVGCQILLLNSFGAPSGPRKSFTTFGVTECYF